MRSFFTFVACTISSCFQMRRKFYQKENTVIKGKVRASELNSFSLFAPAGRGG